MIFNNPHKDVMTNCQFDGHLIFILQSRTSNCVLSGLNGVCSLFGALCSGIICLLLCCSVCCNLRRLSSGNAFFFQSVILLFCSLIVLQLYWCHAQVNAGITKIPKLLRFFGDPLGFLRQYQRQYGSVFVLDVLLLKVNWVLIPFQRRSVLNRLAGLLLERSCSSQVLLQATRWFLELPEASTVVLSIHAISQR